MYTSMQYCKPIWGILLFIFLAITSCQKENFKPTAHFRVSPSFGDSKTVFYFDARESRDDYTNMEGLKIRWDWEGDSVWDTPFSLEKEVARRFDKSQWYFVTMEVMDHSGNTSTYTDTINVWSSFPETGQLVDSRDGEIYKTVKFKGQWLMSENLRYGSWIQDTVMSSQNTGTEFYLYDNDENNLDYGGLYTWYETMNYKEDVGGQGICPEGWHVPTFIEWNDLIGFSMYIRGLGGVPINISYYYGEGSPSGMNFSFFGQGRLSFPSGGNLLSSYGINNSVQYWTSDPLNNAYREEDIREYGIFMVLSKYLYGSSWGFVNFDPVFGANQAGLALCYLRCFKDK